MIWIGLEATECKYIDNYLDIYIHIYVILYGAISFEISIFWPKTTIFTFKFMKI